MEAAGLGLAFALFAAAVGTPGGMLRWGAPLHLSPAALALPFLIPRLTEEFVFRGLLIPSRKGVRVWVAAIFSTLAFLGWHVCR